MPSESPFVRAVTACGLAATLVACAAPASSPVPEPMRVIVPMPSPIAAVAAAAAASAPAPAPSGSTHPLEIAVGYAERLRTLPAAEVTQEVQRLGETSYTPLRGTQLALALAQLRTPAGAVRAQTLLQRVLADSSSEAQGLQGFARLLSLQIADQRRADEQAERQAQQLREAQRRIEQLNDRLEAVRAIERSLPGPARRDAPRN